MLPEKCELALSRTFPWRWLDPSMPTYSGGLGILAGDTFSAAADLGLPMIGVTLLHRQGYFRQHLDFTGVES